MEKVTGYTKGKGIYSEYFEYKKFKLFEKHHANLNSQCGSFLHSMAGADLMRNDEWYNKVKQDFQKALSLCETEEELSDFVQFMEDVANVGGYATEFYNENKFLISLAKSEKLFTESNSVNKNNIKEEKKNYELDLNSALNKKYEELIGLMAQVGINDDENYYSNMKQKFLETLNLCKTKETRNVLWQKV